MRLFGYCFGMGFKNFLFNSLRHFLAYSFHFCVQRCHPRERPTENAPGIISFSFIDFFHLKYGFWRPITEMTLSDTDSFWKDWACLIQISFRARSFFFCWGCCGTSGCAMRYSYTCWLGLRNTHVPLLLSFLHSPSPIPRLISASPTHPGQILIAVLFLWRLQPVWGEVILGKWVYSVCLAGLTHQPPWMGRCYLTTFMTSHDGFKLKGHFHHVCRQAK